MFITRLLAARTLAEAPLTWPRTNPFANEPDDPFTFILRLAVSRKFTKPCAVFAAKESTCAAPLVKLEPSRFIVPFDVARDDRPVVLKGSIFTITVPLAYSLTISRTVPLAERPATALLAITVPTVTLVPAVLPVTP